MQMSFTQMCDVVSAGDCPMMDAIEKCVSDAKVHQAHGRLNLAYDRLETAARLAWGTHRPTYWDNRRPATNETLTQLLIDHCWRDRIQGTIYTNACPSCGTQIFGWRAPVDQNSFGQRFDRNETILIDQLIQHHACRCTHWREDNKN